MKPKTHTKTHDKVCIVGHAGTTRAAAPYDDPSFEFWGCNELAMQPDIASIGGRFDLWWNIHPRAEIEPDHIEWVKSCGKPTFMVEQYTDIPTAVRFPHETVEQSFPRHYWTSTIAWQVAYALVMEYTEIHIYGVEMTCESERGEPSEYGYQRSCLEYWLGLAEGRGVQVVLPERCETLRTVTGWRYGYDQPPQMQGPINEVFLRTQLDSISQAQQQHHNNVLLLQGGRNVVERLLAECHKHRREQPGWMQRGEAGPPPTANCAMPVEGIT